MRKIIFFGILITALFLIAGCAQQVEVPPELQEKAAIAGKAFATYDEDKLRDCQEDTVCWDSFMECYNPECSDLMNTDKDAWGECINKCLDTVTEEEPMVPVEEEEPKEKLIGKPEEKEVEVPEEKSAGENLCKKVEDCGFEKLDFVSQGDINSFYSIYAGQYLPKTGAQVCQEMGYSDCEVVVFSIGNNYYASEDGTCSGMQMGSSSTLFRPCNVMPSDYECYMHPSELNHLEPYAGDVQTSS